MEYDPKTFDPKKHFIKRRRGKTLMFDRQVLLWRQRMRRARNKVKAAQTKEHARVEALMAPKIRNIFE